MHKFYWRNTHGPGARSQDHFHTLNKSGSADNILSEVKYFGNNTAKLFVCPSNTER